jgi:hypothetical protein
MAMSGGGDAKQTVQAPAIALLVVGALYALGGLGSCGIGAMASTVSAPPPKGMSKAEQEGYELGTKMSGPIYMGSGIFALIVSGIIIFGALQMMKLKSYGLAMTSSILGMLPCSFCCIVGLPIGVWSLIVLMKPEVKSAFS